MRKTDGEEYMISPFAPINLPPLDNPRTDNLVTVEKEPEPPQEDLLTKVDNGPMLEDSHALPVKRESAQVDLASVNSIG